MLAKVPRRRPVPAAPQRTPQSSGPPDAGVSPAAVNALYCLRTILKDLMEQLNAAQLLSFIEVPPEALAAAAPPAGCVPAAEGAAGAAAGAPPAEQQQQQAAAAAAIDVEGAAEGAAAGSGASSPTSVGGGGQPEFAHLSNNSLVQVGAGRDFGGLCKCDLAALHNSGGVSRERSDALPKQAACRRVAIHGVAFPPCPQTLVREALDTLACDRLL